MRKALANLRAIWRQPNFVIGLLALWLLCWVSGPFGTHEMGWPARALYWAAILPAAFSIGTVLGSALMDWLGHPVTAPRMAFCAGVTGIVVGLAVWAIHSGLSPHLDVPSSPDRMDVVIVLMLSVIVAAAALALHRVLDMGGAIDAPRLMRRLGPEKRGALVSISGDGRYVEVVTTAGRDRLLLRLADAIAEAAPVEGMQVHRSHWVARAAIAELAETGGRLILRLTDGREVPVSRHRAHTLGLLPQGAAGHRQEESTP